MREHRESRLNQCNTLHSIARYTASRAGFSHGPRKKENLETRQLALVAGWYIHTYRQTDRHNEPSCVFDFERVNRAVWRCDGVTV